MAMVSSSSCLQQQHHRVSKAFSFRRTGTCSPAMLPLSPFWHLRSSSTKFICRRLYPFSIACGSGSAGREDSLPPRYEDPGSSEVCDPLCSVDEMDSRDFEANNKPRTDLLKAVTIGTGVLTGAAIINHSWVAENQNLAMVLVFILGYVGVIFEESLSFNKSGVGLLMAVTLWVIRSAGASGAEEAASQLTESSAEVSEIVFFLLGAMTIVEIVDAHQGFKLITNSITTQKPRSLLWVVWR